MDKTILHCDLNNFYASVEALAHPELSGLPIVVCGNPELRHGIVLAKNQIAKAAGVQTGEPIWQSKQKCPDVVFLRPHFDKYVYYSKIVFDIYTNYTDRVERFGIDECWLDVTESIPLLGSGEKIAYDIKERVKRETGLTISVGVSFTKTLAKLGSDLKKPDAVTVLSRDNFKDRIYDMSPSELIMIGKKTAKKLDDLNIKTIGDLARADRKALKQHFGIVGDKMINAAQGISDEEVKLYYDTFVPKSVSHGTTTPKDIKTLEEAKTVIYALSEMVAVRLRRYNLVAGGISLGLKGLDLKWNGKQKGLIDATASAKTIGENAIAMLKEMHDFKAPLRAITVGAIKLDDASKYQLSFFSENEDKQLNLEKTIDGIRNKYGYDSVKRGILIDNEILGDLHEDDDFLPFKR